MPKTKKEWDKYYIEQTAKFVLIAAKHKAERLAKEQSKSA